MSNKKIKFHKFSMKKKKKIFPSGRMLQRSLMVQTTLSDSLDSDNLHSNFIYFATFIDCHEILTFMSLLLCFLFTKVRQTTKFFFHLVRTI